MSGLRIGQGCMMSNHRRVLWVPLGIAAAGLLISFSSHAADSKAQADFFQKQVGPLLIRRCLECHGDARKGGLDLRARDTAMAGGEHGAVIVPNAPRDSVLVKKVIFEEMPPKEPLSDEESDVIEQWVADGAYFPDQPLDPLSISTNRRAGYDWWSLQSLHTPEIPALAPNTFPVAWDVSPIDHFIGAKLHEKKLTPSEAADPVTLIRRATYDLLGLPPTPEEVTAFVNACAAETGMQNHVGDKAYDQLLDRLLASEHYGEQWGRHWLDVVRFGESSGFEVNQLIDDAWPYRDYIIESFNNDKPYDELVLEQLAGDSMAPGDPKVEVGLTFLTCGPVDIVGNQDPAQAAQIRANGVDDMIRATSETFLGLTVGCARCHDHKFDPISTKDFYRLHATFAGVYPESREVATDAQRQQRRKALAPLEAKRNELAEQRKTLEEAILARAAQHTPAYADAWTRSAISRKGTEEVFNPVEAKFVRLAVTGRDSDPNAGTGFKIDEFEVWTDAAEPVNAALAANGGHADGESPVAEDFGQAYLADLTIDGKFGQSWIARGSTLTITFAKSERVRRVLFSSDRLGALAADSGETPFPCEYRIEVSQDGATWSTVADSANRAPANDAHRRKRYLDLETTAEEHARLDEIKARVQETNAQIAAVPGFPVLHVGRLSQPEGGTHVFKGGDPQRPGDEVVSESLDVLSAAAPKYRLDTNAPERERRLELAKWIVNKDNPLPPRVLANRLWHYHFGTGIVSTPSDFGFMGTPPTHPELLDWLARELIDPQYGTSSDAQHAWQLKRMHKIIMLSQTYRQAGTYRGDAADVDSDARLLWRFPPRRLTGEELRDSMLAVSGALDMRIGGPGFRLYHYIRDNVASYIPLDEYPPDTYRRSVYHQNARASRIDLMTDFDAPDCAMTAPRRVSTTTPLQSLTLMNHSFTLDMAQALATRAIREAGADESAQVRRAFELTLLRAPGDDELREAETLAKSHGLRALCRALFNSNEFMYLN